MKSKIKFIIIIIIGILTCASTQAQAAIAVKPATVSNGSNVLVKKTISDSYSLCQQMTGTGESLYGSTVKPHLATNKDWGAVSYLSNSIYGTNTQGKNTGIQIEVGTDKIKYYSTNGNITGVMNWGSNPNKDLYSFTSGIIQEYLEYDAERQKANENVAELIKNSNTDFVDLIEINKINATTTRGMAMLETVSNGFGTWHNTKWNMEYNPISSREGMFGYAFAYNYSYWGRGPGAQSDVTFRPVIWN